MSVFGVTLLVWIGIQPLGSGSLAPPGKVVLSLLTGSHTRTAAIPVAGVVHVPSLVRAWVITPAPPEPAAQSSGAAWRWIWPSMAKLATVSARALSTARTPTSTKRTAGNAAQRRRRKDMANPLLDRSGGGFASPSPAALATRCTKLPERRVASNGEWRGDRVL